MGLLDAAFAGGAAQGVTDIGKQLTAYGMNSQLAQREADAKEAMAKRMAETIAARQGVEDKAKADRYGVEDQAKADRYIVEDKTKADRQGVEDKARVDAATTAHGRDLQKIRESGRVAADKANEKPVYPKIVKLKDENDKEYLIDQNTGAIGRPISASDGLPAESNWFSPDKQAVPGTKAGIVWEASDGQELPGGLASLYRQMSNQGSITQEKKKSSVDDLFPKRSGATGKY